MKINSKTKELILYLIFGVLTTAVSWASYICFVNLCGFSVKTANVLSWISAVIFAFVTNKIWVFNSREWKPLFLIKEVTAFVSSRIITGLLEIFGVPLLSDLGFDGIFYSILEKMNITVKLLFTEGLYSKIILAVVVIVLNYIFSKLMVFNKKRKADFT